MGREERQSMRECEERTIYGEEKRAGWEEE